nr:MAG TPA: hypothetical protein [Caudoviricetes sp.]
MSLYYWKFRQKIAYIMQFWAEVAIYKRFRSDVAYI